MKTTKSPPKTVSLQYEKIAKTLSREELIAMVATLLGASDLMSRFLFLAVREVLELPVDIRYAIVQHAAIYRMVGAIIRGEEQSTDFFHLPTDKTSWKTEEDFEKRFIFVVKQYYDYLKKEGKIE